jgi:hypothetical protein
VKVAVVGKDTGPRAVCESQRVTICLVRLGRERPRFDLVIGAVDEATYLAYAPARLSLEVTTRHFVNAGRRDAGIVEAPHHFRK